MDATVVMKDLMEGLGPTPESMTLIEQTNARCKEHGLPPLVPIADVPTLTAINFWDYPRYYQKRHYHPKHPYRPHHPPTRD